MLCEKCKQKEATVHLTEIVKNVKSEIHLCEVCARKIGLNSKLSNFTLTVPDMLSFLDVDDTADMIDPSVCNNCGTTFMDYKKTGKLGCSECYGYLRSALEPLIQSFHGEKRHIGKVPLNYIEVGSYGKAFIETDFKMLGKNKTISELKKDLDSAVMEERYEDAAKIRDELKQYEQKK